MNVVAHEFMDKLKLPTKKHPRPYKVIWVNEAAILLNKQCLVAFRIGGYEDAIWYDIIPMNIHPTREALVI